MEAVNKNLVEQLNTFNQLKEENAFLRHRVTDLTSKLKYDAKDLKLLNSKVNEQIQIIELARDTVAVKTKDFSKKLKELADSQVKIVELNMKLEQFKNSQFTMNHMISSQRQAHDVRGLGYESVPPTL